MGFRTLFRKIRRGVLLLVCAGFLLILYVNLTMYDGTREKIVSGDVLSDYDADCILVLGASVRENGSPSLMLRDRLDTSIGLYEIGVSDRLLMSGDHSSPYYDEVTAMKSYAVEAGIPSTDIFLDHAGLSTYESIYRAKYVYGAQRIVIVTQSYHLYRALYLADALGLEAVGVSCDTVRYNGQILRDVREVAARVKDYFYGILKPELLIQEDSVSLEGNGDDTNEP
jgi:vancomycin permeability regulator SanA